MNKLKMTIVGALAVAGAWCAMAANYLTFTAEEANSSVTVKYKSGTDVKYSKDGGSSWINCPSGTAITLDNVGDKVSLKGNGIATDSNRYFAMTGKIAASGDVTSLTNGQGGDATLTDNCYDHMFFGCTALTAAPTLPATTLATSCYLCMFYGCTSLTSAPALPAMTLASTCYVAMFQGCTSLTAAPALPATTLQTMCYSAMFKGCTSLTTVPELPATALAQNCYQQMFYGCTALEVNTSGSGKEWKLPNATTATDWGKDMFTGTSGNVPVTPELNKTYYIASAPKETDCITFSADAAFGIKLTKTGTLDDPSLEYSTDQINWSKVSVGTGYDAAKDGETYKIHFRGTGNQRLATSQTKYHTFTNTLGSAATAIACSGNIMTLLDYQKVAKGEEPTMDQYAFAYLFIGFTALTEAPELPAETLAKNCYQHMFTACTLLTVAPELPAETLTNACYQGMFKACTSLTSAPALPATTLAPGCYQYMFQGCTALTVAPALPAPTLATSCYKSMFQGCTALTTAPALNATTLAGNCYGNMFDGCTSLTTAPALPATTLLRECYQNMFRACTSLMTAPALPAETLAMSCYQYMFFGCTSLTTVPALPATTLANKCYNGMFQGCTSLVVNKAAPGKEWKIPATSGEGATDWGADMFAGTGGDVTGTPELNTTYYIASAPKETDCITFSADAAFGIKLTKTGTLDDPSLEYSTDQINWSKVSVDTGYDAAKDGETYKIHFRGTGNKQLSKNPSMYHTFENTEGSAATAIACSGNIMTLLDYQTVAKGEEPTMDASAFYSLFWGFTALTAAPELPAETLALNCYFRMFKSCTALTAAPELPAMTLAQQCYGEMFQNCTSLTAAPELPAMTAAQDCYSRMFQGCTSLTAAPELNATTLTDNCYRYMFKNCTSLTAAPILPATTLARYCYNSMFDGCTSLTNAPALSATTLKNNCYSYMFRGCTSLTSVPELPATTLASGCYGYMFYGCTNITLYADGTGDTWSIPKGATGPEGWGAEMFTGTGGTLQGQPVPGTTYYYAPMPTVTVTPTAEEHAQTVNVYTNETVEIAGPAPYVVYTNAAVKVVYTADEGYEFPGGKTTWSTNFTANAATVTVTIPASEQPVVSMVSFTVADVANTTNEVVGATLVEGNTYKAVPGAAVKVTYTADFGYFFSDGKKTSVVEATAAKGITITTETERVSATATIGTDKDFFTLQDAFDVAKDGETVALVADIADAQATLTNEVAITLDLAGKTMNCTTQKDPNNWYGYTLRVSVGQLTIDDTVGGGKILNAYDDSALRCCAPSGRAGTPKLIVKAGTFENNSEESGTVYSGPTTGAQIEILGGSFKNTFEPFKYGGASAVLNVGNGMANTNTAIVVKGGTFSVDPSLGDDAQKVSYVAAGFYSCKTAGGWAVTDSPEAKIGTVLYLTLADAAAAAQDGDTVTLLADATADGAACAADVTFDLGGKTLAVVQAFATTTNLTLVNSVAGQGGFVVNGTVSVNGGTLDASGLAVAQGGVIPGQAGGIAVADGATFAMMNEWAAYSPNWLAANRPGFLTAADGGMVKMGETVYTAKDGLFGTEDTVAKATITASGVTYIEAFDSLAAAVAAANADTTVMLVRNSSGDGIAFGKSVTVDFDGHSYAVKGNPVGPSGAEIVAFQLLNGFTVILKNGTFSSRSGSGVETLVENYGNLTLEGMTLNGANLAGTSPVYTVSTKAGSTTIDTCVVNARGKGDYALDTCKFGTYDAPTVTVKGLPVINGNVELAGGNLTLLGQAGGELGVINGNIVNEKQGDGVAQKEFWFEAYAPRGYRWGTDAMQGKLVKIDYSEYPSGVTVLAEEEDEGIPSNVTIPQSWFEKTGADPIYAKKAWMCENLLTVAVSYVLGFDPKDNTDKLSTSIVMGSDGTVTVKTTDKGAAARPLEESLKIVYTLYAADTPEEIWDVEEPIVAESDASAIVDLESEGKSKRFYRTTVTIKERE